MLGSLSWFKGKKTEVWKIAQSWRSVFYQSPIKSEFLDAMHGMILEYYFLLSLRRDCVTVKAKNI